MAKKAKILVHPRYAIGEISPRLYGAFLEPIGTMVNGSMYNPKHPAADDKGFRRDFMEALSASGLPAVRLPGGNFVSGWDWKDSIGPMDERKTRLDPAWKQYIPNDVGHDEYLIWAERAGAEPLYTVNLGTGDINDAVKIIEYTNHESGGYWSDLRRRNGREKPYGVKTWYLGNEMDGPWQIGSWLFNPKGYGVLSNEVSKVMKMIDPTIETVVCASTSFTMPHFPEWDVEVLKQCYEAVDYISLHYYHSAPPGDYAALLGGTRYFEDYIETMAALCDYVQTYYRSPKKLMLSFDEYGTMARQPEPLNPGRGLHNFLSPHYTFDKDSKFIRHDPDNMTGRNFPPMGDMLFALTSASTMLAFLRRADRVKIGCMTGGLRALAMTNREHVWKPAAYYPYTQLMRYGRGVSLRMAVDCDTFDIPGYAMNDSAQFYTQKEVPFIDTAAALDNEQGTLTIFAINRNWEDGSTVEINTEAFDGYEFVEHVTLYSEDMDKKNTHENPDAIVPSVNTEARFENGKLTAHAERLSWNMFRYKKNGT
jgi:alpha-N-arabinofuranosidase